MGVCERVRGRGNCACVCVSARARARVSAHVRTRRAAGGNTYGGRSARASAVPPPAAFPIQIKMTSILILFSPIVSVLV